MDLNTRRKSEIKEQLELEINRKVRAALDTPPAERIRRQREEAANLRKKAKDSQVDLNAHINFEDRDKTLLYKRYLMADDNFPKSTKRIVFMEPETSQESVETMKEKFEYWLKPRYEPHQINSNGIVLKLNEEDRDPDFRIGLEAMDNFDCLSRREKEVLFATFTKDGFKEAMRTGKLPDGSKLNSLPNGHYQDQFGIIRDNHGPFWPKVMGPLHPTPIHKRLQPTFNEPLVDPVLEKLDQEPTNHINKRYSAKWKYMQIVYDSETSPRNPKQTQSTYPNMPPSLVFESRFECGNLRQARRTGQFEYELVLKNDLFTRRHTQWFYFSIKNMVKGATYKFSIINLLKSASLYMQGMRILLYSEQKSISENVGWFRTGHHIRYSRNVYRLHCPLLHREMAHFQLEFQIEFPNSEDVCYLAHCYPYTFTDLKTDISDALSSENSSHLIREVLCETKIGNSCFLLKITDNEIPQTDKFAAVVTARVHPGETNSSWMMKGFIQYLLSNDTVAQELRRRVVFYIIPMLNPDGVIVGNYRCSTSGRDLNRNYRNPRLESFPTIYHTKKLVESLKEIYQNVILYCDLHGHSRKHNVFMYGCDSQYREVPDINSVQPVINMDTIQTFVKDRIFPWLMQKQNPEMFSFNGCEFKIRKCKISTGRVVMWKQFDIGDSYTLETTFSGSDVYKIHFNTHNLETMGSSLCEALLIYLNSMQDVSLENEIGSEVLKSLLKQMAGKSKSLASALRQKSKENKRIAQDALKSGTSSVTEKSVIDQAQMIDIAEKTEDDESDMTIDAIIDSLSINDLDCLNNINVSIDDVEDDSSSDSDSESEPEEIIENENDNENKCIKVKKKKKRSKVQMKISSFSKNSKHSLSNLNSRYLPAINKSEKSNTFLEKKTSEKISPDFSMKRDSLMKFPLFVSKYEGRSNGGIPCFSEERLLERARRRSILSLKKEMENFYKRNSEPFINKVTNDGMKDKLANILPHRDSLTDDNNITSGADDDADDVDNENISQLAKHLQNNTHVLTYNDSLQYIYDKKQDSDSERVIPRPLMHRHILRKKSSINMANTFPFPLRSNKVENSIITHGSLVTVKQAALSKE